MSWTVPDDETLPDVKDLKAAIKEAYEAKILMFGASSDQGYNDSKKPLPATSPGVICIGAAKWSGHCEEAAGEHPDFLLPGRTKSMKFRGHQGSAAEETLKGMSGSSTATALGAGLTALILYCVEISELKQTQEGCREKLQDFGSIKKVLLAMTQGGAKKYINVKHIFHGDLGKSADDGEIRKEFENAVWLIIK